MGIATIVVSSHVTIKVRNLRFCPQMAAVLKLSPVNLSQFVSIYPSPTSREKIFFTSPQHRPMAPQLKRLQELRPSARLARRPLEAVRDRLG